MRYDCKQIREILSGDSRVAIDEEAFLDHVEKCADCKLLGELDAALENALESALAEPAPAAVFQNLMDKAAIAFRKRRRFKRIAALRRHLVSLAVVLALPIMGLNSELIAKMHNYLTAALPQASELFSFGQWQDLNPLAYLDVILHSPAFLVALIGTLLLAWSFAALGLGEISR